MKYKPEEWKNFISIITNVTSIGFSDIIVRNGIIRELNDSKNLIIETNKIESEDIQLQLAKLYIPMFKSFLGSDKVEITVDNDYINISDNVTSVNLVKPDVKLLTCEYLDDTRFNKLKLDTATEVFKLEITESLLGKITAIKEIFSSTLFSLVTNKSGKTSFRIDSWKKTGKSKITDVKSSLPEIELKGNASMFDFAFDDDPVMYVLENDIKQYVAKLQGTINDVDVSLYSVLNT